MMPSWIAAKNPEFARHIWLEMSPHRVIGLPIVIALISLLTWSTSNELKHLAVPTMSMAVVLLLWGAHLAAESVLSEVRERTWHAQRMSALSPWQLAWGKLLGSTLFAWYGTALCLLLYLLASPTPWSERLATVLFVAQAGLTVQAVTMLLCLSTMPSHPSQGRTQSFSYILLIAIVFMPWLIGALVDTDKDIEWYGRMIPHMAFINLSIALFLAWALAGLYRLMRQELQMRQGFAVWLGFIVCVIIYLNGFFIDARWDNLPPDTRLGFFALAMFQAATFTYIMLFLEDASPIDAKQALRAMRQGHYTELMQWMPCWLVSLLLAACCFIAAVFTVNDPDHIGLLWFFLGALLFVVRDVAVLLWVRFRPSQKGSSTVAVVIYLLCSYSILPLLLHALGADSFIPLFIPNPTYGVLNIMVIVEVVIAAVLLHSRWQRVTLPDEVSQ
jgi:hypothetical protein